MKGLENTPASLIMLSINIKVHFFYDIMYNDLSYKT